MDTRAASAGLGSASNAGSRSPSPTLLHPQQPEEALTAGLAAAEPLRREKARRMPQQHKSLSLTRGRLSGRPGRGSKGRSQPSSGHSRSPGGRNRGLRSRSCKKVPDDSLAGTVRENPVAGQGGARGFHRLSEGKAALPAFLLFVFHSLKR